MVLRRPYAFLIKHFRLIHLMIAILLAYLAFIMREIYKYLNSVIDQTVFRYDVLNYINYNIYIYIALALILCFVIYWLLKFKDKPRKMYLMLIVGYIIIGIFMFILFSHMHGFLNAIPDMKSLRLYRDIMSINLLFQYFFVIMMIIRGLGFDLKKFNFATDAQELNADAADSEEIEINTQIDTTNVVRMFNKKQREFGYFFREFKLYIITILVLVIGISGYILYSNFNKKYKVYKMDQVVGSINNIIIRNSYYNTDGDNNYVIVSFDAYKVGKQEKLNTGNMALYLGKEKYIPDKNICFKFSYLGNCYKKQYITNQSNNYIVTFKVKNLNINKAYIVYTDSYEHVYKIKLDMKET